jgi:hypothetical protein
MRWQGVGEGPGRRLRAVIGRHQPESSGHRLACGVGGIAAQNRGGGAADGWAATV